MVQKKSQNSKTVTVEQIGSPIRNSQIQRATLKGLGLNKNASATCFRGYTLCTGDDR